MFGGRLKLTLPRRHTAWTVLENIRPLLDPLQNESRGFISFCDFWLVFGTMDCFLAFSVTDLWNFNLCGWASKAHMTFLKYELVTLVCLFVLVA